MKFKKFKINKKLVFTLLLLVMLAAYEFFFIHPEHVEYWWQNVTAFNVLLGLLSGIGLMKFSKFIGKHWLYRNENYYRD